uniref:Uncharacterized protein n=1 Tax=Mycena chlorophos TaxID=658473 RepID=A0ABQ0L5Q8_MYCCL|nr:predicted protein [Mycena chlorophos]
MQAQKQLQWRHEGRRKRSISTMAGHVGANWGGQRSSKKGPTNIMRHHLHSIARQRRLSSTREPFPLIRRRTSSASAVSLPKHSQRSRAMQSKEGGVVLSVDEVPYQARQELKECPSIRWVDMEPISLRVRLRLSRYLFYSSNYALTTSRLSEHEYHRTTTPCVAMSTTQCLPIAKFARRSASPSPEPSIQLPSLLTLMNDNSRNSPAGKDDASRRSPTGNAKRKDLRKQVLLRQFHSDIHKQEHEEHPSLPMCIPTLAVKVQSGNGNESKSSSQPKSRRRRYYSPTRHYDYLSAIVHPRTTATTHNRAQRVRSRAASPSKPVAPAAAVTVLTEPRASQIIQARISHITDRLERVYLAAWTLREAAAKNEPASKLKVDRDDPKKYFKHEYHALGDFARRHVPGWEAELETLLEALGKPGWDKEGWRGRFSAVMDSIQVVIEAM